MRIFPFNMRQIVGIVIVLVLPYAPLLLTAMSLEQLLTRLVEMLA